MTSQMFAEVIGDPIDHSLSPLIHGFGSRHWGSTPNMAAAELAVLNFPHM